MALQINGIHKEEINGCTTEPLMVTIALEEYRSLIEENTKLLCGMGELESEIARLTDKNLRLLNGGDDT